MLQSSWLGRRVTVRRVVGRTAEGRLQFGDVVGDLVGLDAATAVVDDSGTLVEIPVATVAVAKLAPPSTADDLALEAAAASGWRAAETAQLGGWLLRATGGFTGRANSVLPLRAPGRPLDEALQSASAWYADRGLPLKLLVPTEARRLLDAELAERGWPADPDVHVLTTRLDRALLAPAPRLAVEVGVDPEPGDAWFARYRDGAGADPVARALLLRHDEVGFATVRDGADVVAIGRGTIDNGWLGVSAVEVTPARRRSGLAGAVMRALWRWGADRGAVRSYLQVSSDNEPALALYEGLGYRVHHDYRYRIEPGSND